MNKPLTPHERASLRSHQTSDPMVGQRLGGRYEILFRLGGGGMASVYAARHTMIGRQVAIKVLHSEFAEDEAAAERMMQEARVVGTLGHPHIVEAFDVGLSDDGVPFLVLELLKGVSLAEVLQGGRLEVPRALRIGLQVCSALEAAHGQGVIHRDLKPENLFLVDRPGGGDHVKVLDFGIATVVRSGRFADSRGNATLVGSPAYMAPEQFFSPLAADVRTDVYQLGMLLYEILAGHAPNSELTAMQIVEMASAQQNVPSLAEAAPDLPNAVIAVVDRALRFRPEDRFQSMGDFATALRRLGMATPRRGSPDDSLLPGQGFTSQLSTIDGLPLTPSRWPLAAAMLMLALAIGGLAYVQWQDVARPARAQALAVAPPAPPRLVTIDLRSPTAHARGTVRGVARELPFRVGLATGSYPEMIEIEAPDCEPKRQWLMLDRDRTIDLALTPLPGELVGPPPPVAIGNPASGAASATDQPPPRPARASDRSHRSRPKPMRNAEVPLVD